jgi:hypothetical protein
MPTPRMLQNMQMPEMMKQMPLPSSAALGLPGMSAPTMPSMPSLPNMLTPRVTSGSSHRERETTMPGLVAFQDAEEAAGSVSNGLVEQPLKLGAPAKSAADAGIDQQEYPALMFSFTEKKKRLLFVKVAGSQWCEGIPISDGGASGMVEIRNQQGALNFLFQLSLTTSAQSGPHHRTEVLTFRPRFVIVNRLDQPVHYRQVASFNESTLRPHHKTNFHWPDADAPFEMSFRLLEEITDASNASADANTHNNNGAAAYEWSGGCDISMLGETHLRLRPLTPDKEPLIIRIEVKNHQESLHVVMHQETNRTPPYRIVNRSSSDIVIFQEVKRDDCVRVSTDKLAPNASIPYAWDNPLLPHLLALQVSSPANSEVKMVVNLDAIGKSWTMELPASRASRCIMATVEADGPTKILTIVDEMFLTLAQAVHPVSLMDSVISPFGLSTAHLGGPDETPGALFREQSAGRAAARAFGSISVSVWLDRVAITLVDKHPQELLAGTFKSVSVIYKRGIDKRATAEGDDGRFRSLDISVKAFQLDNMLTRTPSPVAVYSTKGTRFTCFSSYKSTNTDAEGAIFFFFEALSDSETFMELSILEDLNDTVTNVPILKKVSAALQDLELNVEGRLVLLLYLYYVSFTQSLRTLAGHGLNQVESQ